MKKMRKITVKTGAVSIFVVIFSSLLISVVTISFVNLMLKEQRQASSADLSQSAYDSAQAGVEDAKRALMQYRNICESGGDCSSAKAAIDIESTDKCNAAIDTLEDIEISDGDEVKIKTNDNDSLNQAYTCVKINVDTPDYLNSLAMDSFDMIPLSGVSNFDSVDIEWFSSSNLSGGDYNVDLISEDPAGLPLLNKVDWKTNRPPIIQAQLIQYSSNGFNLNDFNSNDALNSNFNSLFVYPVDTVTPVAYSFTTNDPRRASETDLLPVSCKSDLSSGGYACSIKLQLPTPINGGDRVAYLYLGSIYNKTDFRISLYNGASLVEFNGVQPEIDSTGRANDLFRRVKVRVKMTDDSFSYPVSAVFVEDGLCKNFIVTDNIAGYSNSCP